MNGARTVVVPPEFTVTAVGVHVHELPVLIHSPIPALATPPAESKINSCSGTRISCGGNDALGWCDTNRPGWDAACDRTC